MHHIRKTSQNRFPLFASYYDAWSSNSSAHFLKLRKYLKIWAQNLANNYEKLNLWWKGASDPQNLTQSIFAFSQDITMLKKRLIIAFPEMEKISQNLGQNLGQKLWKIESLKRRCIGYTKPHRTVLRFFAKYYGAEEVINKRIPWNWENISKSGHKVWPIIMKNWN